MVQSVTGSNLLAVFPASAAARNLAQQNLVLPSPLPSPQEQAQQRASSVVRFNAPTLSNATLATLQDAALRAQVSPELNGSNTAADSDSASRAAEAYSLAANSLRPLIALGTAPGPVPNLQALAPGAAEQSDEAGNSRAAQRQQSERSQENERGQSRIKGDQERSNPLLAPERQNFSNLPAGAAPVAAGGNSNNAAASNVVPGSARIGASLGLRVDVGV